MVFILLSFPSVICSHLITQKERAAVFHVHLWTEKSWTLTDQHASVFLLTVMIGQLWNMRSLRTCVGHRWTLCLVKREWGQAVRENSKSEPLCLRGCSGLPAQLRPRLNMILWEWVSCHWPLPRAVCAKVSLLFIILLFKDKHFSYANWLKSNAFVLKQLQFQCLRKNLALCEF